MKKKHLFLLFAIIPAAIAITCLCFGIFLPEYSGTFIRPNGRFALPSSYNDGLFYKGAYVIGFVAMTLLLAMRAERYKLKKYQAIIISFVLFLFGFIGAKILFILENLPKLNTGGVSFYGSVFFIPIALPLLALIMRKKPASIIDFCAPGVVIILTFIRVGCFVSGCCAGIRVNMFGSYVILPSQMLECFLDIFLLDCLLTAERNGKFKNLLYPLFMLCYGIMRFLVEFTRENGGGGEHIYSRDMSVLSEGQVLSLFAIFIALCVFAVSYSYKRKRK